MTGIRNKCLSTIILLPEDRINSVIIGIHVHNKSFGEVKKDKDGRLWQTLFQLPKSFCTLVSNHRPKIG